MVNDQLTHKLLLKLQKMQENDFAKHVAIPLLEALGFTADFYGGPYEHGKDVIFWKENEFGDIECYVVQIKKTKASVSTRKTSSFSDIVNQLCQALEKTVPNINGKKYIPARATFITPFPIDTRVLETRFEKYSSLAPARLAILDGPKIASLLTKHCPGLVEELLGHVLSITQSTLVQLSNDALMRALHSNVGRNLHGFYSDLRFTVGKRTNHFLRLGINPTPAETLSVPDRTLSQLRDIHALIKQQAHIVFVLDDFSELKQQREKYLVTLRGKARSQMVELQYIYQYGNRPHKIKKLSNPRLHQIQTWSAAFNEAVASFNSVVEELELNINKKNIAGKHNLTRTLNYILLISKNDTRYYKAIKLRALIEKRFEKVSSQKIVRKPYLNRLETASAQILQLIEKHVQYCQLNDNYENIIRVNSVALAKWLQTQRQWICDNIDRINRQKENNGALQAFLMRAHRLFITSDKILTCLPLAAILSEKLESSKAENAYGYDLCANERLTIRIPIFRLFETGLNFSVYGHAGAGKTTTLQMYARYALESKLSPIVIFVPLSVLATLFRDKHSAKMNQESTPIEKLMEGISSMLSINRNAPLSAQLINETLAAQRSILLLDGIDEVIKECPWIEDAITQLPLRFPLAQVIISSRESGNELSRLPFLGLTIREFSDAQRTEFITNWFAQSQCASISKGRADIIISHLRKHPKVCEIIKNPLTATILCVLGEHDLPLPQQEIQLYKDRMRLLLGEFDNIKQIRRVDSHPDQLLAVAVKLAYWLHSRHARYDSMENIRTAATRIMKGWAGREHMAVAVASELAHPCNILVPMNTTGDYGFGHLRFQEYLCACELQSNRNIAILPLLYDAWWQGPLVLLAQMSDDCEFLFQGALDGSKLSNALPTLDLMVKDKPQAWVDKLDEWLSKAERQSEVGSPDDASGDSYISLEDRLEQLGEWPGSDIDD
jgi:hypothetical protein